MIAYGDARCNTIKARIKRFHKKISEELHHRRITIADMIKATIASALLLFTLAAMAVQTMRTSPDTHGQSFSKFSSNASSNLSQMWSDCSSESDSVKILALSVTPDPPEKGQKVMADMKLQFTEEVEGGSLSFKVKYNSYFPVVNKKKDLCNIPKILNEPCPIQPGVYDATLYQTFPSYALSGTYVGKVIAKDKSGNELMCIELKFSI